MKKMLFVAIALMLVLLACAPAPQPQPIIIQAPPQQQQQQSQQVIINEAPAPPVVVAPQIVPAPGWCGNVRPTYLSSGMTVHVSYNPDKPNVIRRSASQQSEYMGALEVGGRVYLLDGPYCDRSQFMYWHVQVIDKSMIDNRQFSNSQYNSVYTAETDTSGAAWLVP